MSSAAEVPANLILSRRDLEFLLYEWLDVESLTERKRFSDHSRETFDAVMELSEQIAVKHFAPHNKKADANEPHVGDDGKVVLIPEVEQALRVFNDAGLISGQFDDSLGGLQLPTTVSKASLAWFQAANTGTATYPFLTIGNANLLIEYGGEALVDKYVRPMLEGRFHGTMCLSEPGAGSSLAYITTKAVPQDDGTYAVSGTKMWISGGEHELGENIVHLVLAKIPGGPAGVKGISLFVVPKTLVNEDGSLGERNDVNLVGLNHKMGYRGTTNTLLAFGEKGGATGYLVGEPHKGLSYMFKMMNEARIGVGMGATALGYTGYLHSVAYARDRAQGRPVGDKDPAAPQVPIIDHADVRRMLLAQKSYVEGGLALGLYCSRLVDEQITGDQEAAERAGFLLDVLTPIAKAWPSQWCLEANNLAIQVHGGYGYTRDYNVEQFYRDNRLNPIHEGTNGIQGLDLLGRKVVAQGGRGLQLLVDAVTATIDAASGEYAEALKAALDRLVSVTGTVWGQGDPEVALANSSAYLDAAGHLVVAWLWLDQLNAVGDKEGAFYDGKRVAAQYFFRYELPKTGPMFDLLVSLDRTTLDLDTTVL
ncbi:acyl-CoA dehydrogenase [Rhodococcus sp. Leaf7]|uniref:acyl-CoA dehydrogenase n=1 Tax=unclassified Rhodococcus (in: high G+C Gram-positive bacteria) TaxID=192944 RepID=UPI0006FEEC00|nr:MULTISPECIES: acyl-CoA dehydrogenase [unclassified Rhodococcus (in: high G+C Gram-positive bacteria)]KQU07431.1 acyl-CoA dehydrogenase [Rhodococcus sp. Leaf7]KQU42951.1 acyl-CoA dehydrogenase [Rhodococcus sp. Leaf247]